MLIIKMTLVVIALVDLVTFLFLNPISLKIKFEILNDNAYS